MRSTILVIVSVAMVLGLGAQSARADYVDDYSGQENIGSKGENSSYYTGCYGDCGADCAWYRCGHTSACVTHDYNTRTYGLWSSQAMNTFAPAIRDWGACITGRGKEWVSENVVSKVTGAARWLSETVRAPW